MKRKGSGVRGEGSAGSALVETAIMLPIAGFLLVGTLYFGSAGVLRQELFLLTRYAVETDGSAAFIQDPAATVPVTGGAGFPDGEFARWNGALASGLSSETYLTDTSARDEMTRVSWRASADTVFDPQSGSMTQGTNVVKTFEGYLFYDCQARDRAPEVADQQSRWMHRRSVSTATSHDAALYGQSWGDDRYAIAGLPAPTLATSVTGVARSAPSGGSGWFTRDLPHAYAGTHPAVEDVVVGYWQGTWPVSAYPVYKDSGNWWIPD